MAQDEYVDLEEDSFPTVERDVFSQPLPTEIKHISLGDVQTYYMRRWGIFRKDIIAFSCLIIMGLNLLTFGHSVVWFFQVRHNNLQPRAIMAFTMAFILTAASVAGIFIVLDRIFRKMILVVKPTGKEAGEISWTTKGILGKRERHFLSTELRSISTRETNKFLDLFLPEKERFKAVGVYYVHSSGRRRKLIDGEERDMRWLATRLRRDLDVPRK